LNVALRASFFSVAVEREKSDRDMGSESSKHEKNENSGESSQEEDNSTHNRHSVRFRLGKARFRGPLS
jgi:hypothetical protein